MRVEGSKCRVQGVWLHISKFRVGAQRSGMQCSVQDSGFMVQGAGCRVQGQDSRLGFRVRIQGEDPE